MRPASSSAYSVLVVEDDPVMGALLTDELRSHGYDATWVVSVAQAEQILGTTTYDVALVDLGLPDGDGVDVVRTVRVRSPDTLVLIVTDRETEIDIIVGLDAGADDYLTKPVNVTVLLARLRAHLRRAPAAPRGEDAAIVIDDLTVDAESRRCQVLSREVGLRPKEFDLLWQLVQHRGHVVSRLELMSQVWDENWSGSTKTLDVTMAGLRRQLREVAVRQGGTVPQITTMRGRGYRLDAVEVRRVRASPAR
jgi:DNA-binding response OmpR family regulator